MQIDIKLHKEDLPDQITFSDKIAIDCEMTGLNVERDRLCLVQISSGNNRTYLNHTSAGNSLNLWDFQWTAPASDVGPIKIYYAYNVAGYPYTNTSGDLIYTNHITLRPSNSTLTCNNEFLDFQCYVVDQNQLNIISNINSSEQSIIKIYNMIGEEVFMKKLNFFNNQTFQLSLPSNLTSGTYIVYLKVGKEIKTQKIIF